MYSCYRNILHPPLSQYKNGRLGRKALAKMTHQNKIIVIILSLNRNEICKNEPYKSNMDAIILKNRIYEQNRKS